VNDNDFYINFIIILFPLTNDGTKQDLINFNGLDSGMFSVS
jgi:hypothetical protein